MLPCSFSTTYCFTKYKFQKENPMQDQRILVLVIFITFMLSGSLSYTLNQNLIINGNFSEPIVTQSNYFLGSPLSIPGWHCSDRCQIDNCTYKILLFVNNQAPYPNCTGQVLDIDAIGKIQNITQNIDLEYGYYALYFEYFWPFQFAYKKTLLVYFNDELIFTYKPQLQTKIDKFSFSRTVTATKGNNQLTFTQTNDSFSQADSVGFRISNISLRQISNNPLELLLNYSIDSSASNNINLIPGARVIFGELLNMFVNLDRYQFYYYHNRNYSINSLIFLRGITLLLKQKGGLVVSLLSNTEYNATISNFLSSLDYKQAYSNPSYLLKDEDGTGFITNNAIQVLLNLPIYLMMLLLAKLAYALVKNSYIRRLLLKYTMAIIVLLMVIQGNVEQYSYYMFAELSNFFSASFRHKIANVSLIAFFYIFILSSVGIVWFICLHYKDNGKVLIKGRYNKLNLLIIMLEKGVICILLGLIHQLLLNDPNLQLFLLIVVETILFLLKLISIYKALLKDRLDCLISIMQRVITMMFQIHFYFEGQSSQADSQESSFLNIIIYIFLAVWSLSCLYSALELIIWIGKQILMLFNQLLQPKRVQQSKTNMKSYAKKSKMQNKQSQILNTTPHRQHLSLSKRQHNKTGIKLVYQTKKPYNLLTKKRPLQKNNLMFQKQAVLLNKQQGIQPSKRRNYQKQVPAHQKNLIRFKSSPQDRQKINNKFLLASYLHQK